MTKGTSPGASTNSEMPEGHLEGLSVQVFSEEGKTEIIRKLQSENQQELLEGLEALYALGYNKYGSAPLHFYKIVKECNLSQHVEKIENLLKDHYSKLQEIIERYNDLKIKISNYFSKLPESAMEELLQLLAISSTEKTIEFINLYATRSISPESAESVLYHVFSGSDRYELAMNEDTRLGIGTTYEEICKSIFLRGDIAKILEALLKHKDLVPAIFWSKALYFSFLNGNNKLAEDILEKLSKSPTFVETISRATILAVENNNPKTAEMIFKYLFSQPDLRQNALSICIPPLAEQFIHLAAKYKWKDLTDNAFKCLPKTIPTVLMNAKTYERLSPLHIAAMYGNADFIKLALDHVKDLKTIEKLLCEDSPLGTPLHAAIARGHHEVVKLILDYAKKAGIKTDLLNTKFFMPRSRLADDAFSLATKSDQTQCLEVLLRSLDKTPELHIAAMKGDINLIRSTLDAVSQEPEKIKTLLCEGSPLGTPLHAAIARGHHEVVKLILDYAKKAGIETDLLNTKFRTSFWHQPVKAIYLAIHLNQAKCTEVLLQSGDRFSPVRYLGITYGLRMDANSMHSPLNEALQLIIKTRLKLQDRLLFYSFDSSDSNTKPIRKITKLLNNFQGDLKGDLKALLNHTDESGISALSYAIKNDCDGRCVDLLIKKGANPNITNSHSGNTPMHYAVKASSCEILSSLLKNGANLDARNKRGVTAFEKAIEKQDVNVLKVFLEFDNIREGGGSLIKQIAENIINNPMSKIASDLESLLPEGLQESLLPEGLQESLLSEGLQEKLAQAKKIILAGKEPTKAPGPRGGGGPTSRLLSHDTLGSNV